MDDTIRSLEKLIAKSKDGRYVLRLYTAGMTPHSTRALENVKAICDTYLSGRYELTVIDLSQQPHLGEGQQVIAAPTLVKALPPPMRRLIGDLSDSKKVLLALDLAPDEA